MSTPAQIAANRRNAQKSTGPITQAGRSRTRLNALQHGITRQVTLMADHERPAFMESCAEIVAEFAPVGAYERRLAQTIAEDYWRLDRSRAAEHNLFTLGSLAEAEDFEALDDPRAQTAITHARVILHECNKLGTLSLYEQRLNRSLHKNLALLRELQTERKAAERDALEEALRLREREVEASKIVFIRAEQGVEPEPLKSLAVNGFVFSNEDLDREIDRRNRYWEPEPEPDDNSDFLKTAA